ncbi:hypothetical protein BKA62DRAFT_690785 [Auriculariales sp. MPI-PUGE-AT-0066]|nr:hypothetical protein BKA62DRAFT_690785 [Auriculariales sp. MPI-PUGE-AT-0066]
MHGLPESSWAFCCNRSTRLSEGGGGRPDPRRCARITICWVAIDHRRRGSTTCDIFRSAVHWVITPTPVHCVDRASSSSTFAAAAMKLQDEIADVFLNHPKDQWDAILVPIFENLEPKILATKYLTAFGFVLILAELFSGIAEEYELIWKGRKGLERNIFIIHRIIVPIGLLFAAHITAGILPGALNSAACEGILVVVGILSGLSIFLADGLVTMEVWQLWDCDRSVMKWMIGAYTVQGLSTLAFMSLTVKDTLKNGFTYQEQLKMCTAGESPRFLAGTWASGMTFELLILGATILNVLSKPRTGQSRLVRLLIVDGVLYFGAVISLRLINLISALKSDPATFFAPVFCTWALVSVLVTRVVMNQSRERQRLRTYDGQATANDGPAPLGITIVSHTQAYELPTKMPMSPGMPAMNVQVERESRFRSGFM